jgi:hypothetical protein
VPGHDVPERREPLCGYEDSLAKWIGGPLQNKPHGAPSPKRTNQVSYGTEFALLSCSPSPSLES